MVQAKVLIIVAIVVLVVGYIILFERSGNNRFRVVQIGDEYKVQQKLYCGLWTDTFTYLDNRNMLRGGEIILNGRSTGFYIPHYHYDPELAIREMKIIAELLNKNCKTMTLKEIKL